MRALAALLATLVLSPLALATLTDPVQNDAGTGGDAGDAPGTATKLMAPGTRSADGTYRGLAVLVDDPEDWYAFEMRGAGKLTLDVVGSSPSCAGPALPVDLGRVEILLVDPQGAADVQARDSPCGFSASFARDASPGIWRIGLRYLDAATAAVPGTPIGGGRESSQDTLEMEYDLALQCKPFC